MIGPCSLAAPVLRPYQVEAVDAIREAFALFRRVLLVLPTGGGKTVIFAFITRQAARKGNRVIVLTHRQEIIEQISAALAIMDVPHGHIRPNYPMTDDLVLVGMVQTVALRLEAIPAPVLLIIDEAHHAVAGTWSKIAAEWPHAKILGVTATPERLDGRGLGEAFDKMVIGPDVRELIDADHLASFHYLAPDLTRRSIYRPSAASVVTTIVPIWNVPLTGTVSPATQSSIT
jgi:DNA repair protein RadD